MDAATASGWSSLCLQALLLACGLLLGYLAHFLRAHSSRCRYEADERRKLFTEKIPIPDDVEHIREWLPNARGALLFRQQLVPAAAPLRGVIGICHGFMDHTNSFHTDLALRFCKHGYAVIMMDAEGHGLSDGVYGYIRCIDDIVGDCSDFFLGLMATKRYAGLPFFVYGESMGGAVAFNLCTKSPCSEVIRGAVLVAPMLKIAEDMVPVPRRLVDLLKDVLIPCIPYAPLAPVRDILPYCYKKEETFREAQAHSLHFDMKPRLGSALAMLEATQDISRRLSSLTHRVLIIHGGADTVTCPSTSAMLHRACQAEDKQLKIYPGCLHGLMKAGDEPRFPEIFSDIISWLHKGRPRPLQPAMRGGLRFQKKRGHRVGAAHCGGGTAPPVALSADPSLPRLCAALAGSRQGSGKRAGHAACRHTYLWS